VDCDVVASEKIFLAKTVLGTKHSEIKLLISEELIARVLSSIVVSTAWHPI
jgi:hypothetical protein